MKKTAVMLRGRITREYGDENKHKLPKKYCTFPLNAYCYIVLRAIKLSKCAVTRFFFLVVLKHSLRCTIIDGLKIFMSKSGILLPKEWNFYRQLVCACSHPIMREQYYKYHYTLKGRALPSQTTGDHGVGYFI